MSETPKTNVRNFHLRAQMPLIIRVAVIVALAATIIAIGIGFYRNRNNVEFRLKSEHTQLSKDAVAEVIGYERTESEGDVKKYYIKADRAVTFADNHLEMENAVLQVFDETAEKYDQITAQKTIYIPEENKNFTAYFAGKVNIDTRDALAVKTEQLFYKKETETAEAEELIEFSRENISGKSLGATVKIREKTIELLRDVEIVFSGAGDSNDSKFQQGKITAGHAFFNQTGGKINFTGNVNAAITPVETGTAQPTDIKADRADAFFTDKEIKKLELNGNVDVYQKPTKANGKWTKTKADRAVANIDKELKQLELFENVNIETASSGGGEPTQIKTGYAIYQKDADRFELKNGVEIVTAQGDKQTVIESADAIYEQTNGKIYLSGGAEITQASDYLKGDNVTAEMSPDKNLKNAFVKGNAYLKQTTTDRTTEITGNELNAVFGDNRQLQTANALGASSANIIPAQAGDYSKVTLSAPVAIRLVFGGAGFLREMQTEGRTTVAMLAPGGKSDASNKRLTADAVKTTLNASGKDLAKTEAVGNAELFIDPLTNSAETYRTTTNAARFDCEFYEKGNAARNCVATGKTKTVRVPTVAAADRSVQTIVADRMDANFNQQSSDIQQLEASGDAKFSELDRNGVAERIVFTAADGTVRLRGGEPTIWDARGRAKAVEIDWDTRAEKSMLRGKVATTFISQKQTGGATPFGESNAPVFVTSDAAEFQHQAEIGIYTGNARAWQENNYLRADRITLRHKQGQLYGEGAVQTMLYDMKRKDNGKESNVPVFAQSKKLFYSRDKNVLRYETDVDIRQGTDRIVAGAADVYLTDKNEVAQTVAETNVVVTSPNRTAVGDYAQYVAADESIVLRGKPARIDDAENGTTQAAQVTMFLKTNKVVSESKTNQTNTGRIRTVYKIKKQ